MAKKDCFNSESETRALLHGCNEASDNSSRSNYSVEDDSPRRKYLKECCKPSHLVKSRGAIIVLMWNILAFSVFNYLVSHDGSRLTKTLTFSKNSPSLIPALSMLLYPIVGWLADVHFGRYRTVKTSLWIMWTGSMLCSISIMITELYINTTSVIKYTNLCIYLILIIGLGGFQANIIQFGVDQLSDASTNEIISFVSWYSWTGLSSGFILQISLGCLPQEYHIFKSLLITISLSLALCIDFFFSSKWLVKEPVTQNPFKLVKKVVAYAFKNKHPRMRSAFTYCEDELPSRIDLAKVKYGGPFTTEQVEDVKTFFRMLLVLIVGTSVISMTIILTYVKDAMFVNLEKARFELSFLDKFTAKCLRRTTIENTNTLSVIIWVPLCLLVILPLFRIRSPFISIMKKFTLGITLVLLYAISLILLDRKGYHGLNRHNTTAVCIVKHTGTSTLNVSFQWFAISNFLYGMGLFVLFVSVVEFICAQSPYSMKGLLVGTAYGLTGGISLLLTLIVLVPFKYSSKSFWRGKQYNCGFWLLIIFLILVTSTLVLFHFVQKRYKKRKREDVLPNEQFFVTKYYENQLLYNVR